MKNGIDVEPEKNDAHATGMTDGQNVKMSAPHPDFFSLRPSLFWDVNLSKLDLDQHAAFIIVRTMERGTREEVRTIWNYYGESTIKKHLLEARSLHRKTISYFANKFHVSRTQFKSFDDQKRGKTWPSRNQ